MSMHTLPRATVSAPFVEALAPRTGWLARGGARLSRLALGALARTVLCFAALHVAILAVHAVSRGDAGVFNLFTMVEAQRLWPALATHPAAPGWSVTLGLVVYGMAFAFFSSRSAAGNRALRAIRQRARIRRVASHVPAPPHRNGTPVGGGPSGFRALHSRRSPVTVAFGITALVLGLASHMVALASVDALVRDFPSVPDVVHDRLPYFDFGAPGEWAYAVFMLAMVFVLFRRQPRTVPGILALLGVFYAMRGLFLFLLPIGSPPSAPGLDERFVFWPFAGHAYFPGGHTGMMTVLSLSVAAPRWRRVFLAATVAFALGTMIARTHYTADAFGGWLLGYAVVLWGRARLGAPHFVHAPDGTRAQAPAARGRALLTQ
jgi:hypothetical protein